MIRWNSGADSIVWMVEGDDRLNKSLIRLKFPENALRVFGIFFGSGLAVSDSAPRSLFSRGAFLFIPRHCEKGVA